MIVGPHSSGEMLRGPQTNGKKLLRATKNQKSSIIMLNLTKIYNFGMCAGRTNATVETTCGPRAASLRPLLYIVPACNRVKCCVTFIAFFPLGIFVVRSKTCFISFANVIFIFVFDLVFSSLNIIFFLCKISTTGKYFFRINYISL